MSVRYTDILGRPATRPYATAYASSDASLFAPTSLLAPLGSSGTIPPVAEAQVLGYSRPVKTYRAGRRWPSLPPTTSTLPLSTTSVVSAPARYPSPLPLSPRRSGELPDDSYLPSSPPYRRELAAVRYPSHVPATSPPAMLGQHPQPICQADMAWGGCRAGTSLDRFRAGLHPDVDYYAGMSLAMHPVVDPYRAAFYGLPTTLHPTLGDGYGCHPSFGGPPAMHPLGFEHSPLYEV